MSQPPSYNQPNPFSHLLPYSQPPTNPLPGPALQFIPSYATPLIESKLSTYTPTTGRDIEALIARDDYLASLTDLQFRNGLLIIQSYYSTISSLYTFPSVHSSPEALVKAAE